MRTIAVTPGFRAKLLAQYPKLSNPAYLALLGHILFTTFVDDRHRPIVSMRLLAKFEGKVWNRHYVAKKFLKAFGKDVFKINYSKWSWTGEKARSILGYDLHPNLIAAYVEELSTPRKLRSVNLVTGAVIEAKTKKRIADELLVVANAGLKKCTNGDAKAVAEYMNSLPAQTFSDLTANLEFAEAANSKLLDGVTREYNRRLLCEIGVSAKPFYAPSAAEKTVRIFPINASIGQLSKEVRCAYLAGCVEVDIAHAHFAINAALWNIPRVTAYLKTHPDIWKDLADWLGGSARFNEVKAELKTTLYAIFYGAELGNVRDVVTKTLGKLGLKRAGARLFEHPVIDAIVRAREIQLSKIKKAKGAKDVYGRFIKLGRGTDEKSILSQLAQAVEMKLMRSVIDLAKTTNDFRVVLWLHDGCTVKFTRASAVQRWLRKICDAIVGAGKKIKIPVEVKTKNL